jgi:hypothetical protein
MEVVGTRDFPNCAEHRQRTDFPQADSRWSGRRMSGMLLRTLRKKSVYVDPPLNTVPQFVSASPRGDNQAGAKNTVTTTLPPGVQFGDLLIATVQNQGGTPVVTAPDGWALQGSIGRGTAASVSRIHTFTRWVLDDEPTDITFTLDTANLSHAIHVAAYRGVGSVGPYVGATLSATSRSSAAMATATAPFANSLVVITSWMLRITNGSQSWPTGVTERLDDVHTPASNLWYNTSIADRPNTAAGTTPSTTVTYSSATGSGANGASSVLVLNPRTTTPRIIEHRETSVPSVVLERVGTTPWYGFYVPIPKIAQTGDLIIVAFADTPVSIARQFNTGYGPGWNQVANNEANPGAGRVVAKMFDANADARGLLVQPHANTAGELWAWSATVYVIRGVGAYSDVVFGTPLSSNTNATSHVLPAVTAIRPNNLILGLLATANTSGVNNHTWPTGITRDGIAAQSIRTDGNVAASGASVLMAGTGTFAAKTVTASQTGAPRAGLLVAIPAAA